MPSSLNVAIAAGGTAGHINPALALAEELAARGHAPTFFGQQAKLEGTLVPAAGFELVPIVVSGFDRSRPWTGVTALVRTRAAQRAIARRLRGSGTPDVAIGFGAYVETPLLAACASLGVPTMVHEQNSVPGLANRMAAKKAACACVALPAASAAFEGATRVAVVGNPVRRSVVAGSRAAGRAALGVPDDATLLVVFGGSLGARHLNQSVAALKGDVLARDGVYVVHSTGKELYDETCDALALAAGEAERWGVRPYIENMGDVLAAADLVLSRAGASSIAEIAALSVPSVLVPYPLATADHQTTNARSLVDVGAARLVADDELESRLASELLPLLDDAAARARMRAACAGLDGGSSAARLADELERVAGLGGEAAA